MKATIIPFLLFVILHAAAARTGNHAPIDTTQHRYGIADCVNEFNASKVESTAAGYQYWFVDKNFLDGRTVKLSVVRPHSATHPPHSHPEDEIFFVLEGRAEFFLNGRTRTAGAYTSFYCPPNSQHGIRNIGDAVLKYLVIKKYKMNMEVK